VQVSPPQEHVVLPGAGYPWWQRYQPVSYRVGSRSGDRAQFQAMVSSCHAAGVKVYADAVINHMAGSSSGTGSAGSPYSHYDYPGTYQTQDFHHCGRNANDDIVNYRDRWEVQNCELVDLSDLDTGAEYVRGRIAGYLNDLLSLGVDGFRIDGAKHIAAADVANIVARLSRPAYVYQEVIFGDGEPILPSEYRGSGDLLEFRYGRDLGRIFRTGQLAWFSNLGEAWGYEPTGKAVTFVDNHDTQRDGGDILTYKDGQLYTLANVFQLAWPYGSPKLMSSYAFTARDAGPPSDGAGHTNTATCFAGGWVCEHRWRPITNMVGFHNAVRGTGTANWWSNGGNQIAFSRGDRGFLALNREGAALTRTFTTGLPAGTYCDVLHGDLSGGACTGPTVTVEAGGGLTATVASMDGLAVHAGAKVTAAGIQTTFDVQATTTWGQNVFVVGSLPALGSWDPARAVPLSSAAYPAWRGTVALPPSTGYQYKYVKKTADGTVTWESDPNRAATTPATGTATRTDTWR
jgi:alpha-amylase